MGFISGWNNLLKGYDVQDKNIYIYGLGTTGRLLADFAVKYGVKIAGLVVGDGYKDRLDYQGFPVYELSEINPENAVFIYTVKSREGIPFDSKTKVINCNSVQLYHEYLDIWYEEYFENNSKDVLFEDNLISIKGCRILNPKIISENEWYNFLQEMGDILLPELFNDYYRIDEGAYRYKQVGIKKGDVVVDAGANLGVFSAYAAYFGVDKCYAFEPMDRNYSYLKKQSAEYPNTIIPVKKALDKDSGDAYISCDGSESSMYLSDESIQRELIQCISLDEFVEEERIEKLDFIKADIEGAECNMLRGAKTVLRELQPQLAICTYHRPTDKDELTEIILNANPKYKIEYNWKKLYAHV